MRCPQDPSFVGSYAVPEKLGKSFTTVPLVGNSGTQADGLRRT